jgi:hypothetical protein
MSKVYQPIVIEETENLIKGLIESQFFSDYDIDDYSYAKEYISDILTQKFIDGSLEDDNDELFTEDEFTVMLQEIIAGSILNQLKQSGLVNSYEDETVEETFFLTEKGKGLLKNNDEQL